MLDRKTENIDASLELLEDRRKQNEIIVLITYAATLYLALTAVLWIHMYPTDMTNILLFTILSFVAGFLSIMISFAHHRVSMYIFLIKRGCTKKQKE